MAFVELNSVSLSYPVLHAVDLNLKSQLRNLSAGGLIARGKGRNSLEVRALIDINLKIAEGDRVGVVGHNGAGKTTLLKVVAGIYRPQAGTIKRQGHAVALINPSNGLKQDFTGYENIENIGMLSGLTHRQISARIDDIAEFTELGDFLSLPVVTYSAGMQTRLAFAVATSLDPEILVADEAISAGDAHFMEGAQKRMAVMMEKSSILVLATHSIETLRRLCNRAILLHHGRVVMAGSVDEVAEKYQATKGD
jgi:ABC-2 type transport system ATP-binding protein/lipopolysaccharide transport system ATP-binding protein